MTHTAKIATCCYCGARAALVLEPGRHELSCSTCGAPLHELKRLPTSHPGRSYPVRGKPERRDAAKKRYLSDEKRRRKSPPRKKRRSSFMKDLIEEAFDVIEDIFD
ncbi:hypothetical protein [Roseobacter ponti]|uniref:Uncharacterized protein n=1 Tax=Roseobacter ponti TaxID=1891787 RepID=A0A858SRX4_9RHOB|nr:hypothetical protein [Roseobacter ponti]QJF50737.1 hypothetical protein G3256_05980 [Roseobacter ponti]